MIKRLVERNRRPKRVNTGNFHVMNLKDVKIKGSLLAASRWIELHSGWMGLEIELEVIREVSVH